MRKAGFMEKGKGKREAGQFFRFGCPEEGGTRRMAIFFGAGEVSIGLLRGRGRDVARFGGGGLENFLKGDVVLEGEGFASFVFGGDLDCFAV